ncbi:MAG: hypothetical protein KF851_11975 [Pirellulaceae bacterium]|nr:hypothetical protein [Pirellulaceae bacterium]
MSQNSPFPPVGPNKPFPGKPDQLSTSGSGGGAGKACGCFVIGCGGMLALMVGLCGFGYYAMFYTAWPLNMAARQFEKSGAKIEGLRGNITSGVEVDSVEVPVDISMATDVNGTPVVVKKKYNNKFKDLKLKYRGGGMFSSGFVVEEISMSSGELYMPFSSNDTGGSNLIEGLGSFLEGFHREISNVSFGSSDEFRVDKVVITDLKLIDPQTEFEYHIDEISYQGLNIIGGDIADIGDLRIKTDNIDVATVPGGVRGPTQRGRNMSGSLKPGSNDYVISEIPFEIDYELDSSREFIYRGSVFGEQIKFSSNGRREPTEVQFSSFSPDKFIRVRQAGIHASEVNLRAKVGKTLTAVESEGSFKLGDSEFSDFSLGIDEKGRANWVAAKSQVGDREVTARLYVSTRFPLTSAHLSAEGVSEDADSLKELWADVAFGKPWSDLDEEQQQRVANSVERQLKKMDIPDNSERFNKAEIEKIGDEIREKVEESLKGLEDKTKDAKAIKDEIREKVEESIKEIKERIPDKENE